MDPNAKRRTRLFTPDQIAPCGMNCGACSGYLAWSHDIPRKRGKISHCSGCRARKKRCAYLKGACGHFSEGKISFCFECPDFPCDHLRKIDLRYRTTYDFSFIRNLEEIRDRGMTAFLRRQTEEYRCVRCGVGVISIHNRRCFSCERIVHWRS